MVLRAVEKEGAVHHETKRKSKGRTHRLSLQVVRSDHGKDQGTLGKGEVHSPWERKGADLLRGEDKRGTVKVRRARTVSIDLGETHEKIHSGPELQQEI